MAQQEAKKLLRAQTAKVIGLLSDEQVERESRCVVEKTLSSAWFENARRIGIYVGTKGEIATDPLIIHCLNDRRKKVFIPRFRRGARDMEMLQLSSVEEFSDLEATLWNIRQHSPSQRNSTVSYDQDGSGDDGGLDVVLVPGVAFTRRGERLGHGMGYFDRFFHDHKERFGLYPLKVALSLQCQLVDHIPTTAHDVSMDMIITSRQE